MISDDLLVEGYRRMLKIRIAEETIAEDFRTNKIFSFLHLYIGQEAVATGVALALETKDRVFGNHRSHGHYLAKGGDLYRMFCEIYGKADGCCKGKGGSMHMLDKSVGFMGSTPILGSIAPIATGSAFEQQVQEPKQVTVAYIGDGASEEGSVYESINLAALFQLPMIFVIENNHYSVASPESSRRSPDFSRSMVMTGLGARYFKANGNRMSAVYDVAQMARKIIRDARGPVVIETEVFRHMAHSGPVMDEKSRVRDTEEIRKGNCPIKTTREQLIGRGFGGEQLESIARAVELEVADAFARAQQAPEPEPHVLRDVYA